MKEKHKHGFFPQNTGRGNIFSQTEITPVRERQNGNRWNRARLLTAEEIKVLEKNENCCENWDFIKVKDPFNPELVKNCIFRGIVRIGKLEPGELRDYERSYPCGLYNSTIISSDIGDYCSLSSSRYISEIITGDYVILADNDEILTSENAVFGNCILKKGEKPGSLRKLNLINEGGGRSVPVFSSMRGEDIYIWTKYRDRSVLMQNLREMTLKTFDSEPGYFSFIDNYTIIKGCGLIKDIFSGRNCRIIRADAVEDTTILSTAEYPVLIKGKCIVRHGIIGEGSVIEDGSRAENFFLAPLCRLKDGIRLYHSYMGSSSTAAGCEIKNSFIYPFHEQHHNNSFLIAALVMGQSNIAAGAVLGSNHNGRMNDCEMQAGRGFRPGLCSSVRYNSRFASFTLLTKSDFPYQLDIQLPFSLVNNNVTDNCLEIIPAYWWLYNMYALFRNFFDLRKKAGSVKELRGVELDFLAPDTVEEIIEGLLIIDKKREKAIDIETEFRSLNLDLPAEGFEGSERMIKILRLDKALRAYREMLVFYCGYNIFSFISESAGNYDLLCKSGFTRKREEKWVNLCGHLISGSHLDDLLSDIESKKIISWEEIHSRFDALFTSYRTEKLEHAAAAALTLYNEASVNPEMLEKLRNDYYEILIDIEKEIIKSRKKDYTDPMRKNLFASEDEMENVVGPFDDDLLPEKFREFFIDMIRE